MEKNRIRAVILVLVLVVVALILLARMAGGRPGKDGKTAADISAGTAYLQALEQQDPASVDEALKQDPASGAHRPTG